MSGLQFTLVLGLAGLAVLLWAVLGALHRKEEREEREARRIRMEMDARISINSILSREGKMSYMEVWLCPHCNRMSRIARSCKWCLHDMPRDARYLTVPEKDYVDQFSLPDAGRRGAQEDPPHTS